MLGSHAALHRIFLNFPFPPCLSPSECTQPLASEEVKKFQTRIREGPNSHREIVLVSLGGGFTSDETPPSFVRLVNDFDGVFLGLGLAREGKDVLSHRVSSLFKLPDNMTV